MFSENPNIFEIDYNFLKNKMKNGFGCELIENRFNPKNFNKFQDWGFETE